jgi:hypothetical protein
MEHRVQISDIEIRIANLGFVITDLSHISHPISQKKGDVVYKLYLREAQGTGLKAQGDQSIR